MRNETICAISTAQGMGAIAVIRLSGSESINLISKVFKPVRNSVNLQNQPGQTVLFGTIHKNNELIDEVLVSFFRAPHTYTGQDVIEIACHGSVYIQQTILQLLITSGARLAQPGEFTQRAYLNGKMDLAQAEAVADLIASESRVAHRIAMQQMKGGVSEQLAGLRSQLLRFIALIELELDFSEEDVEFANRAELNELLNQIKQVVAKLIKSFELGNAIKSGVPVAIVGEPNVGKSTLLNAILNEERAIVSEIAGTTRDSIEDTFNHKGITFRFIDTAGIRHTTDAIEQMGIERTYKTIDKASLILALFNATDSDSFISQSMKTLRHKAGSDKHVLAVLNKVDLVQKEKSESPYFEGFDVVRISAKEKKGIDTLLEKISEMLQINQLDQNTIVISNMRHFEALSNAGMALDRAVNGLQNGLSNDFLAMDIREVISLLAGITGNEITTDEVLGHIFGHFCIGK